MLVRIDIHVQSFIRMSIQTCNKCYNVRERKRERERERERNGAQRSRAARPVDFLVGTRH